MSQQNPPPPPPNGGPPYGAPPQYGTPQYGPPPKRGRGPLILIGVLVVVLLVVLAVGAVVLLRANDDSKPPESKTVTRPSTPAALQFRPVLKAEPNACSESATPATDGTVCGVDKTRYTLGEVELDGTHVVEVKPGQSQDTASWLVNLTLDDEGARTFEQLTAAVSAKTAPQNQLAILVRGRVVIAPTVMSAIPGGKVQITAKSREEAEKIATDITG